MADEAVLRIVMQDDGAAPGTGAAPPQPQSHTPGATPPNAAPPPPQTPAGSPPPAPPAPPAVPPPAPPATPKQKPPKPPRPPRPTPPPKQTTTKTDVDRLLDVADKLRGTIGGLGGALLGGILDVISAYRSAAKDAAQAVTPPATAQPPSPTGTASPPTPSPQPKPPVPPTSPSGTGTKPPSTGGPGVPPTSGGGATPPPPPPNVPAPSALGAAAPYVTVFAVAIVAATTALKALVDVIHKAENQYANYSPQIAQAQAYEIIRQTQGDLRRAQEIAPEMAKYIKARADLEQRYEDAKVRILNQLLPLVTRLAVVTEQIIPVIEGQAEFLARSLKIFTTGPIDVIIDLLRKEAEAPLIEDPTSAIFKDEDKGGVKSPTTDDGKWWL